MRFKIKSFIFIFSLFANGVFTVLLVLASLSPSKNVSFYQPDKNCLTAAAVVSVPKGRRTVFNLIEITLAPGEKALLQFSAVSGKNQANFLINALFDPNVISVSNTGYGVEITALSEGSTLMQAFSGGGFQDVALVTVAAE